LLTFKSTSKPLAESVNFNIGTLAKITIGFLTKAEDDEEEEKAEEKKYNFVDL